MEDFTPTAARLGQLIAEAPDRAPHLEFFLEIDFAEGEFDDETQTPFLRINHLRPPGKSWRSLANQKWENAPPELDAVMLMFRASNPVTVNHLHLGDFENNQTISASIDLSVDFELEADRDHLGEVPIKLDALSLELGPLKISTRLEKQLHGDDAATRQAIVDLITIEAYGPLQKVQGGFAFPPLL